MHFNNTRITWNFKVILFQPRSTTFVPEIIKQGTAKYPSNLLKPVPEYAGIVDCDTSLIYWTISSFCTKQKVFIYMYVYIYHGRSIVSADQ